MKRLLPVASSLFAIVFFTITGRWLSDVFERIHIPAMNCPCIFSGDTSSRFARSTELPVPWPRKLPVSPTVHDITHGRPDILALVREAAIEATTTLLMSTHACRKPLPQQQYGLFVSVCGPNGMVKATKQAVADVQKEMAAEGGGPKVLVGFHAEAPEW